MPLDLLYEVRAGKNTTTFKEQGAVYSEDCCFSLIVGPNYDTIDLVAKSSDEANIWVTGLRLLTQRHGMSMLLFLIFFSLKSYAVWIFLHDSIRYFLLTLNYS